MKLLYISEELREAWSSLKQLVQSNPDHYDIFKFQTNLYIIN